MSLSEVSTHTTYTHTHTTNTHTTNTHTQHVNTQHIHTQSFFLSSLSLSLSLKQTQTQPHTHYHYFNLCLSLSQSQNTTIQHSNEKIRHYNLYLLRRILESYCLRNFYMSPISLSVCLKQAFPAWCNVTLQLIVFISMLQTNWSVVNTKTIEKHFDQNLWRKDKKKSKSLSPPASPGTPGFSRRSPCSSPPPRTSSPGPNVIKLFTAVIHKCS